MRWGQEVCPTARWENYAGSWMRLAVNLLRVERRMALIFVSQPAAMEQTWDTRSEHQVGQAGVLTEEQDTWYQILHLTHQDYVRDWARRTFFKPEKMTATEVSDDSASSQGAESAGSEDESRRSPPHMLSGQEEEWVERQLSEPPVRPAEWLEKQSSTPARKRPDRKLFTDWQERMKLSLIHI